jgi:acetyl esterase
VTFDPVLLEILSDLPPAEPIAPASAGAAEVSRTRAAADAAADELAHRVTAPGPDVASVHEVRIPVGETTIGARLYRPDGDGPFGAHVYLHGGSWNQGSPASFYVDATCRERCAGAGVAVLSVDYRMAPEHVFPTAVTDSWAALDWIARQPDVDGRNLSVGGGSAGGNLAAAVALMARDRGGPELRLALLEVPALDLTGAHLDADVVGGGDPSGLRAVFDSYLGERDAATNPLASPLLADDLTGLPAFHIMTAEHDPLRGDGEAFLRRLTDAGIAATGGRRAGHIHPSASFTAVFEPAREWRAEVLATLAAVHAKASAAS